VACSGGGLESGIALPYVKDCASTRSETAIGGAGRRFRGRALVKRPGGCRAKGRRLLGGKLRTAAELHGHHADFMAM
jgi:hypothetical protein